ncbi:MAG: hypothetical protein VB144_10855 [Clostridia bacterium]|nr:hypothetical protein [Clostridia bacterium]
MPNPALITAADLAGKKAGDRVDVAKGTIVTPSAWDYAHEHSISIIVADGGLVMVGHACASEADEIASRIVKTIVGQLRAELGRVPTRDEAIALVRAVVERARTEAHLAP